MLNSYNTHVVCIVIISLSFFTKQASGRKLDACTIYKLLDV